jgi:hypothetical protein
VLDASSRAGRALMRLAERLQQSQLRLPHPQRAVAAPPWWRRIWPLRNPARRAPNGRAGHGGLEAGPARSTPRRGRAW